MTLKLYITDEPFGKTRSAPTMGNAVAAADKAIADGAFAAVVNEHDDETGEEVAVYSTFSATRRRQVATSATAHSVTATGDGRGNRRRDKGRKE